MRNKACVLLLAATAAGCTGGYAGQSYTPVVDVYGSGKDPNLYAADLQYCQMLAEQGNQLPDTAKGAGVGALLGGAAGALAGTTVGRPGYGAGVGAGLGALAAGAFSGQQANVNRQGIVMQCLQGRGWTVLSR